MTHRTQLRPLYADVDAMNVVYHGNYLRFFELGRVEFMRTVGLAYRELAERGWHLPVTEAGIAYRRPALYDDVLAVEAGLAWVKRASLRFDYRLLRPGPGGDELLSTGHTVHAAVDQAGRVCPLPEDVRALLGSLLAGRT